MSTPLPSQTSTFCACFVQPPSELEQRGEHADRMIFAGCVLLFLFIGVSRKVPPLLEGCNAVV